MKSFAIILIMMAAGKTQSVTTTASVTGRILLPTRIGQAHWSNAPAGLKRERRVRDQQGDVQLQRLVEYR